MFISNFTAVLFKISRSPSIDEWIKNMVHAHSAVFLNYKEKLN